MAVNRSIGKILIANRGEIAVRVIRTCRELGIQTVAVYSDPDRTAPHVRLADEAYRLGPASSSESYLRSDKLLEIAKRTGAKAIHPGYGFLSENASFAEACSDEGITFIGPPAEAIRSMGDKTAARTLMDDAGVPMAPGTLDAVDDKREAHTAAADIGYPVLIKAAAGGGGKGMRIVHRAENFGSAFEAAKREAAAAFGDGRVFIEKYITEPRHIEFQIFADAHGNIVHLFERECSIQRRHQKVIEEAPSSVLDEDLRTRMGESAVAAARSCGYVGAGTVEFLLDADGSYYFMEMNTRLQVEHPVTEMVTGTDLVAAQIAVASGEELPWAQDELTISGHAVECRVYAEDPMNNFLPAPGPLIRHDAPAGPGVRVDSGVEEGGEIPIHYDPMVSKLCTWGTDRLHAIRRMRRALDEYEIAGVPTTIPFCRFVMDHEAFISGRFSTHFVEEHFDPSYLLPEDKEFEKAMGIAAGLFAAQKDGAARNGAAANDESRSNEKAGFSAWRQRRK